MRPTIQTVTLAAADADGICQSQTPAAGGQQNLTINGALASGGVATMDRARHVSIASAGNDSARTFTVTGTDRYGNTISEAITGPNATTVNGTKNFLTVTQVSVDDDTVGAITVGSANECETGWIPLDHYMSSFKVALAVHLSAGANMTYAVQHTLDNVQDRGFLEDDADVLVHDDLTAKTTSDDGNYAFPPSAIRLAITSHVAGTAKFISRQAGQ